MCAHIEILTKHLLENSSGENFSGLEMINDNFSVISSTIKIFDYSLKIRIQLRPFSNKSAKKNLGYFLHNKTQVC